MFAMKSVLRIYPIFHSPLKNNMVMDRLRF